MIPTQPGDLSIIVPILNEAGSLHTLCYQLSLQQEVAFELIFCDGGSKDATNKEIEKIESEFNFPIHFLTGKKGRATQMNFGAQFANHPTLLFLHADSSFNNPLTLKNAIDLLKREIVRSKSESIAGRFSLRFEHDQNLPISHKESMGYYFYESKARLSRYECINGDQGFMMRYSFFLNTGMFDESLPFLEDKGMASRVANMGKWILFPEEIITSSRRFQTEGLYERQILNAIIMNFYTIGWKRFFQEIPYLYSNQDKTKGLLLYPVFAKIDQLISEETTKKKISLWWGSGKHVLSNAWQIAFCVDSNNNFYKKKLPGAIPLPVLHFFNTMFTLLGNNFVCKGYAALATWTWFKIMLLTLKKKPSP